MHSTNYTDTFIEVAADCPKRVGTVPAKLESVAGRQHNLVSENPYSLTSDELLYQVHQQRSEAHTLKSRDEFFAKAQACLRASPLAKQYGWGIHHDTEGKIALYGLETERYKKLQEDESVKKVYAMRNKRASQ